MHKLIDFWVKNVKAILIKHHINWYFDKKVTSENVLLEEKNFIFDDHGRWNTLGKDSGFHVPVWQTTWIVEGEKFSLHSYLLKK